MQRGLIPITCYSERNVLLRAYADCLSYSQEDGKTELVLVRLGGYPEMVDGLCAAMVGGSTVTAEIGGASLVLHCRPKQYDRQISHEGAYQELVLRLLDDTLEEADTPVKESTEEEQTALVQVRRNCYILCPPGDRERLYEEIDRKSTAPMIPAFRDYLLEELQEREILTKLDTVSLTTPLEVWRLSCSPNDRNIISVLEEGLALGTISIPGASPALTRRLREISGISEYLSEFSAALSRRIQKRFTPVFDPSREALSEAVLAVNEGLYQNTGYRLYPAQCAVSEAVKRKVRTGEPAIIRADCGAGKTKIGLTAALAGFREKGQERFFMAILCPAHMVEKWCREAREVDSGLVTGIITSVNTLKQFYRAYRKDARPYVAVIAKEQARDGYLRYPAVRWKLARSQLCPDALRPAFVCPACGEPIRMEIRMDGSHYETDADAAYFRRENDCNHKCGACGSPLWAPLMPEGQSDWVRIGEFGYVHRRFAQEALPEARTAEIRNRILEIAAHLEGLYRPAAALRRFPLSSFFKKQRIPIDCLLCDELHQYAKDSGQGDAMAEMARTARQFIGMTATLVNGYASGIFHLLYRLFPNAMQMDHKTYGDVHAFVKEYGVLTESYTVEVDYNQTRRSRKSNRRERELPGISPLVYCRFLLDNTAFLSLSDIGEALPEYEEFPIGLNLGSSVQEEYERLKKDLREIACKDRRLWNKIQSGYLNLLTVYPDQPYGQPPILEPFTREPLVQPVDTGSYEELQEKEEAILELVDRKLRQGENVLIYTSWVRIDAQKKLRELFTRRGYPSQILTASVTPKKREAWVEQQLQKGMRILICNPSVVETGIDLNAFTTLIYHSIGYNLFTLRQSSRRSWRINQRAPRVEVYFLYYRHTMQERALELMSRKLVAASLVEGGLTDEGLAALNSDSGDLMAQLAQELVRGIEPEVADLAEIFGQMAYKRTERTAEAGILPPPPHPPYAAPSPQEAAPAESKTEVPEETVPLVYTFAAIRSRKTQQEEEIPEQLSLFGIPA